MSRGERSKTKESEIKTKLFENDRDKYEYKILNK